jgi:hypothetical protein
MDINYEFDESNLEEAFKIVDEYIDEPIKPNEFTAKMMAEKYGQYSARHWLNKLDAAVKDGKLKSRRIKGGGKAFWIPSQEKP